MLRHYGFDDRIEMKACPIFFEVCNGGDMGNVAFDFLEMSIFDALE